MPGFDFGERLKDSPPSPDLETLSTFITFFSATPLVYAEVGGVMIELSALNWGGGG